jgi:hypothetical protein
MSFLAGFADLSHALLLGAVMLDAGTAAQGDFALVICSGHGPVVPGVTANISDTTLRMDGRLAE